MFKNWPIWIILSFGSNFFALSQVQPPQFWHLHPGNGLPIGTVNAMVQDHLGFMWLGGVEGLYRYDGYQFAPFLFHPSQKEGLFGNNIKLLYEDRRQVLWIVTTGKGLHYYDRRQEKIVRLPHTEGMYINALREDADGNLWMSNQGQLGRLDPQSLQFQNLIDDRLKAKLATKLITDFVVAGPGEFWVGTAEAGLFYVSLRTGEVRQLAHQPQDSASLPANQVERLYLDAQKTLWVGTRGGGLARLAAPYQQFRRWQNVPQDSTTLGSNTVFDIREIDQTIWVATDGGGISLVDKATGQLQHLRPQPNQPYALAGAYVRCVYQDPAQRVWVGLQNAGVNVLDKFRLKFSVLDLGPASQAVATPIFRDSRQRLWVGTDRGLFLRDGPRLRHFTYQPLVKGSYGGKSTLAITEDHQGTIWLGGWGAGLNRFEEKTGTFQAYTSQPDNPQALSNPNVTYLRESRLTRQLLVATWDKLNLWQDQNPGQFAQYNNQVPDSVKTAVSHIQANIILHIGEDSDGQLWLGSYYGLHRLDPKTLASRTFLHREHDPKSLSTNDVLCFYQDRQGRRWVGTSAGLNQLHPDGSFARYSPPQNISVQGILEDARGQLWLSSNNGLYRFEPSQHTFKRFDEADGLPSKEFRLNSAFADRDGTLYFGGLKGVVYFNPALIQDNPLLPKVYFTDFKIFNQSVKIGDYDSLLKQSIGFTREVRLRHEQSVFSIDFVALNFTQPEKNQYAYQLEGFDPAWRQLGTQRSTTYTNLDPGTYTFKVMASNNDGHWTQQPATLTIVVLPPWWKTWWFRGGLLLAVVLGAGAYYRLKTAALKRQNQLLELRVAERTRALQAANDQIQHQNAELQASEEELRQNMEELEANQEFIQEQKKALETAYQALSVQSVRIADSIRYAQRIQQTILPDTQVLGHAFAESLVILKPKDVVSGDFYWYLEVGGEQFLAVVDCTGHGVPGAFMSMIGSTLLNEIVNVKQITEPSLILDELHRSILHSLNRRGNQVQDGMDLALCAIAPVGGGVRVRFSGARRPLHYFADGCLAEVRPDRASIGQTGSTQPFSQHELCLQPGDILYMATDGWVDTVNPTRDKFGSNRLKEMLAKGAHLSLSAQQTLFETILADFALDTPQRDDLLLVGVKL
jgi:ligand-binding sensor domain-containing protein/serine phosphatase RsbU (regulator of sigma subunit)